MSNPSQDEWRAKNYSTDSEPVDDVDRAVALVNAEDVVSGQIESVGKEHTKDTAVCDDNDGLGWVLAAETARGAARSRA